MKSGAGSFVNISNDCRAKQLLPPESSVRLPTVIDTDPFNEMDDQFALAYALRSPDRFEIKAVHAAPFANSRSKHNPAIGMEKSYQTALQVLDELELPGPLPPVLRGAPRFMTAEHDKAGLSGCPILSEATESLVKLARRQSLSEPLYVVSIAAITNVASALISAPDIIEKVVVVWLAGHPYNYHHANEFNLRQDIFASRVILDCGVPLVIIPCANVAEHLRISQAEVQQRVAPSCRIGAYLAGEFMTYAKEKLADTRPIWDIAPLAWLINPKWVETALIPAPLLTVSPVQEQPYQTPLLEGKLGGASTLPVHCTWSNDPRRHTIRTGIKINRDAVFSDLFKKLDS